jgi:hypothetical protein
MHRFDLARGFNKIHGIVIMFFEAGSNANMLRSKIISWDQSQVASSIYHKRDSISPLCVSWYPPDLFIKCHDDHRSAKAFTDDGLFDKFFLAFLQRN